MSDVKEKAGKIKKSGLIAEFKKFALRGNVIDLAVGVIIGGAFQKIVTSIINDLIMPFVGLITGGTNFTDKFAVLKYAEGAEEVKYITLTAAKEAGATVFAYGSFVTAVFDFFIMAIIIFLLIKGLNKLSETGKKLKGIEEKIAEPTTKKCTYCLSEIAIKATRCPHCTSEL